MPVGIDAVLVPGHITRILWVLAENQCTVDQEIVAEDRLDGVHYGVVGGQPVSPTEEQVARYQVSLVGLRFGARFPRGLPDSRRLRRR